MGIGSSQTLSISHKRNVRCSRDRKSGGSAICTQTGTLNGWGVSFGGDHLVAVQIQREQVDADERKGVTRAAAGG